MTILVLTEKTDVADAVVDAPAPIVVKPAAAKLKLS